MYVARLTVQHLTELQDQGSIEFLRPYLQESNKVALAAAQSFTAIADDGKILFCAGLVEYWAGRAEAWAIFDKKICKPYFLQIHHAVKRFLNISSTRRIEAAVDIGFKEGHRWALALGFKLDAPLLVAYRPDGGDCSLYSRVKER